MSSIFDEIVRRKDTDSLKWDYNHIRFGRSDILPMWVADMDFKSPKEITNSIVERAHHGVYGYTEASKELNDSIYNWLRKRHNWTIDTKKLTHSPGVVTSVINVIQAFTQEEEKILMQTPIYYPFYSCINNNGYFQIDFEDLEEKLKDNVKMMIFCSPHNPIGRVWTNEELRKVANLCKKYDVILISDEIHFDLVYKNHKHTPLASLELYDNIVTLISPTKTFNIAGLSISSAIIEKEDLKKKFVETLNKNGANMLNIFGIEAAKAGYTYGENWLDELIKYLEENLNTLEEYIEKNIPQIKVTRPEATYLAWLDCNGLPIEKDKIKDFFINKVGIGLNDGATFGIEGQGYQRLNFACPREVLLNGLEKIKIAVENL